jgi:hypothetical protein
MFIDPLNGAIIDIIAVHSRPNIDARKDQTRAAHPIWHIIALEKVIARNQIARPRSEHEMAKFHNAIVTNFCVI